MKAFALAIAALLLIAGLSWAGGGWYLLVPTLSDYNDANEFLQGYRVLVREPLSKWNHAGTYDTAAECETDRSVRERVEHSVYTRASDEYKRLLSAQAYGFTSCQACEQYS